MEPAIELEDMPTPDAKPIALVAPSNPIKATPFAPGKIYGRRFRDAKPINFGKHEAAGISRPWRRRVALAGQHRLAQRCAARAPTSSTSRRRTAATTSTRCSARTGDAAEAAGLKRGAYHFFYWCRAASEQADWFIRNVPKVEGALPPVIDVEYNHLSSCKRRHSRVRKDPSRRCRSSWTGWKRHYGQRPVIYTAPDFYKPTI
jgi:lysozyme